MNQTFIKLFFILLFISFSIFIPFSYALEGSSIQEYQATYTLKWHGMNVGKSTHTVTQTSSQSFIAEVTSKPTISALPFDSFEKSEFSMKEHQIHPKKYEYNLKDKGQKKSGKIAFDWKNKNIRKSQGTTVETLPFSSELQDKITYIFQLQQDLKNNKPLNYTVAEPKGIKNYTFTILGEEKLETPIGPVNTLKLEHISPNKKRRTVLWLAKDLNYIMVKLQQIQKGSLAAEGMIQSFVPKVR